MTAPALVLALLLSGTDDLVAAEVGGVSLRVPAAWKHAVEPALVGGGDTHRYDAPSQDASFELSVFRVDPKRPAGVCLEELLGALGKEGWQRLSVGAAPAARKVTTETPPGKKDDRGPPVEVATESFVGCNGSIKWALTMTSATSKRDRFEALARQVVGSIGYRRVR